jgi:hypothetical protein
MRYIPETDRAISIDDLAAQGRAAIRLAPVLQPQDVFAAESLPIWFRGLPMAIEGRETARIERLQDYIARDLHEAMHHRPHQADY